MGSTTPGQSETGSDGHEGIVKISQSSRTEALPSGGV